MNEWRLATRHKIAVDSTHINNGQEYNHLDAGYHERHRTSITSTNTKLRQVSGFLCDNRMSINLNLNVAKVVARPISPYAVQCRVLIGKDNKL